MLMLLLFRTSVENGRGADREGRCVQDDRKLVATRFVVERLLIGDGQAEAVILLWEADTCESALVQLRLQLSGPQPRCLFAPVVFGRVNRIDRWHALRQPRPSARGEFLDRFRRFGWRRRRFSHNTDSSCSVRA